MPAARADAGGMAGTMAKLMGIDVGSTTVKVTVVEQDGTVLYRSYERHYAQVRETVLSELEKIRAQFGGKVLPGIDCLNDKN